MKKNIETRKNIINSLKPTIDWSNKSLDKRVKFLKGISVVNIILTIICAGILFSTILSELIGLGFKKWENIGLFAILSLSFVLNLPHQFYELKLTKHLIHIKLKNELGNLEKLNDELKTIITKLNDKIKNNWHTLLLAVIILILGMWQMASENGDQIWSYMKLPIMIFYGIILFKFWKTNKSLNRNINAAVHTVANNV
jgi:predicted branched-subunit amino acid permease